MAHHTVVHAKSAEEEEVPIALCNVIELLLLVDELKKSRKIVGRRI